ncbi:beta-N-acetylhexosaminidase [Glaciecola petra]|uniref:beta-N-acetylhexosaminidase n=1 Tax=Glaciecola petra TaxID=3075602 RepID=A0ABU2ZUK7_9ALTE|nr:beta-N-acetylhexosaminidase [Aestuariibacter sp. P117]MDT0596324.1 beta-N-acetylhexosaminidase [Aestuariibacter sp. P117]
MANNIIVGCHTLSLSNNEISLFRELDPLGFILFARNIDHPSQVIALTEQFKQTLNREDIMVLIDQEGGRVSRLPNTYWRVPPSPTIFAQMYLKNTKLAERACYLNALLTGLELKGLGINVNCAPMLDVPQSNAASIISERALGTSPEQVIALGKQIVQGIKDAGLAPVIKHLPGHGRATSDSHLKLPLVSSSFNELARCDFLPFQALSNEAMAMSAHVVFSDIDSAQPATISATLINKIVRQHIGFDGLLMSDDINMQALSGDVASRAEACLSAGCDVALHCSGNFEEMKSLLDVATQLEGQSKTRADTAEKQAFAKLPELDPSAINTELNHLLSLIN